MAGLGSRFTKAGYPRPKYEIEVLGRPLFDWSMLALEAFREAGWRFTFATRREEDARPFLAARCAALSIAMGEVIELDGVTDGQATTALLLAQRSAPDAPFAVFNIDTFVAPQAMAPAQIPPGSAGWVPCFPGPGDGWSFCRTDAEGRVAELREKVRISPHATVGLYWFASAAEYIALYQRFFSDGRGAEKGERYVAPMYNQLITEGALVTMGTLALEDVGMLGTPEQVEGFRAAPPPAAAALIEAPAGQLHRLLAIMARLRDPVAGCEWDRAQSFATIAPYTIEEAYEVADAIQRGDHDDLRGELGDLLLQVVFHARIAEEAGLFAFDDVARAIADKMEARHPHIFGDATTDHTAWETLKAAERKEAGATSTMDGVARALPALLRADKLQRRAARDGFDWPDTAGPRAKVAEEMQELAEAAPDSVEEEAGDLLFAAVNLVRACGIDAEQALRRANDKFERRYRAMETMAGGSFPDLDLERQEALWQEVKAGERDT